MKKITFLLLITPGLFAMEVKDYFGSYTVIDNRDSETKSVMVGKIVVINNETISIDGTVLKWKNREVDSTQTPEILKGETDKGFVLIQKTHGIVILAVTLGPMVQIDKTTSKWTGELLHLK